MMLGHVQRFVAATAAIAVFVGAPVSAWAEDAPSKSKKKEEKVEEAPEPEPEPVVAPEPEPEPAPEPEPEPEPDVSVDASTAAAATAGTMKGRVGIGGVRTLSGLNALGVRYYPINKLDIGAVLGFATFSHREAGDDGQFNDRRTVGLLGAGVSVFYWPVQMSREKYVSADFGLGVRGVIYKGFLGDPDIEKGDLPLEIDIEIPITTALFIGDSVAIIPEFGFVARIIPGNREPDEQDNTDENPGTGVGSRLGSTDGPGLGFELGEHGGVFFGLSIMYYFGGDKAKAKKAAKKAKKGK
jgi:hypothetical protein